MWIDSELAGFCAGPTCVAASPKKAQTAKTTEMKAMTAGRANLIAAMTRDRCRQRASSRDRRAARGAASAAAGMETVIASLVGEDVDPVPSRHVQLRPPGQEVEAGLGEPHPAFALQHDVQPLLEPVQMRNVAGGVGELFGAELGGAPVGALLRLREVDAHQLAHDVLQ